MAVDPKASDYLWALLSLAAGISFTVTVFEQLYYEGLSLAALAVVAVWLVVAFWIVVGAWRRTVWGCRVEFEGTTCPRHGSRCRRARIAEREHRQQAPPSDG